MIQISSQPPLSTYNGWTPWSKTSLILPRASSSRILSVVLVMLSANRRRCQGCFVGTLAAASARVDSLLFFGSSDTDPLPRQGRPAGPLESFARVVPALWKIGLEVSKTLETKPGLCVTPWLRLLTGDTP